MRDRIRQALVLSGAVLDIAASFWLGTSLDQVPGADPTPVYFLPVNLTFAVWGVIFTSALVYAIYQALPAQTRRPLHRQIGWFAAANAWLTALWIFLSRQAAREGAPDAQPIFVVFTVFVLFGMLFCLTNNIITFRREHDKLTRADRWLAQIPGTIFFAWLNVAAIANITAAFDAYGVTGEPYGAVWAAGMLGVATVLAVLMIRFSRPSAATLAYSGVILWALLGILLNNTGRSELVVGACVAAGVVVALVTAFHLYTGRAGQMRMTGRGAEGAA
jgi:uncharacterized membrane protein YhaH (DUF805 family)